MTSSQAPQMDVCSRVTSKIIADLEQGGRCTDCGFTVH